MATETRESVLDRCRESWPGETGERRARDVDELLRDRLPQYAAALGMEEADVFSALERRRSYCPVNYYQACNLPRLDDGVRVFKTRNDMMEALDPERGFICPSCGSVSRREDRCTSGFDGDGKPCDWKAYGLFGTLGKGLRVMLVEGWLDNPRVHEIFMPVALAPAPAHEVADGE